MTSLLLTMLALGALTVGAPAAQEPTKKPNDRVVTTTPVKSFVYGGDGELQVLQDQGIAWVRAEKGHGGPLQLLDLFGPRRYIGVQLITLTPELRRHFGVPEDRGVMVSKVIENTPAAEAGVEVGDVLITAGGSPVVTAGDVTRVLESLEPGSDMKIELWRDGEPASLAVAFEEGTAMTLGALPHVAPRTMLLRNRGKAPIDAQALADKAIAFQAVRQEDLDEALQALDDYFESGEWQQRVKQLESLDLDEVQQRMKTLERRLQELERELAEKKH